MPQVQGSHRALCPLRAAALSLSPTCRFYMKYHPPRGEEAAAIPGPRAARSGVFV